MAREPDTEANTELDAENTDSEGNGLDKDAVDEMLSQAAEAHGVIEGCIRLYGSETMHQITERVWVEILRNGEVDVEDVVEGEPPDMLCQAIRLLGFFLQDPTGVSSERGKRDENWYEGER